MREVRGEGLGRELREEARGARSHCSSCSISSSSVRPPAGRQANRVRGQDKAYRARDKGHVQGLRLGQEKRCTGQGTGFGNGLKRKGKEGLGGGQRRVRGQGFGRDTVMEEGVERGSG